MSIDKLTIINDMTEFKKKKELTEEQRLYRNEYQRNYQHNRKKNDITFLEKSRIQHRTHCSTYREKNRDTLNQQNKTNYQKKKEYEKFLEQKISDLENKIEENITLT